VNQFALFAEELIEEAPLINSSRARVVYQQITKYYQIVVEQISIKQSRSMAWLGPSSGTEEQERWTNLYFRSVRSPLTPSTWLLCRLFEKCQKKTDMTQKARNWGQRQSWEIFKNKEKKSSRRRDSSYFVRNVLFLFVQKSLPALSFRKFCARQRATCFSSCVVKPQKTKQRKEAQGDSLKREGLSCLMSTHEKTGQELA